MANSTRARLSRLPEEGDPINAIGYRVADFSWATLKSRSRERRVVAKVEWMPGRDANPRFVVALLVPGRIGPQDLYKQLYCARGDMENRIKECQLDLFADRTSAATKQHNNGRS